MVVITMMLDAVKTTSTQQLKPGQGNSFDRFSLQNVLVYNTEMPFKLFTGSSSTNLHNLRLHIQGMDLRS